MPLFRGKRDVAYVKRLNRELIEQVIGEKITYYPISKNYSQVNFYGESKEKIVDPPVELYALVNWQEQEVTTTEFGQDKVYLIDVFIHDEHLVQREVEPIEGDFIDYDGVKFEVTEINEPKLIWGKAGERIGKRLNCRSVREGTFKISISGAVEHAKRTSPDNKSDIKSFYDNAMFPFSASSD